MAQLQRCVDAAEGSEGVLCADGHVGYSQPIGGVVAYREHLSPSGVGYDIGCGNKAVLTSVSLGDVQPDLPRIMDEIFTRISFGVGRNDGRAGDHSGDRRDPRRRVRAPARAARPRRQAARHRRRRQPLRGPLRRRAGARVGGRALRLARVRAQDGVRLPRARPGAAVRRARVGGRDGLATGPPRRRVGARRRLRRGDDARGPLRLRGPRRRLRGGVPDPRRRRARRGPQPPQLRLARGARRRARLGRPQGRDAGLPGPARLRRRDDGRAGGHPRRRRVRRRPRRALLDRPRRRPGDVAHPGRRSPPPEVDLHALRLGAAAEDAEARRLPALRWAGEEALGPGLRGRDRLPERPGRACRQGHRAPRRRGRRGPAAYKRLADVLAHHEGTVRVLHTLRPIGVAMAGADTFDPYKD